VAPRLPVMNETVTRRITPAGFLLALLLFLVLPLATASCDVPPDSASSGGTLGTSISGADLVVSHEHLDADGGLALSPAQQDRADLYVAVPRGVQILALLTVAALLAATATPLIRRVRVRAAVAAGAAVAALALVAVMAYLIRAKLTESAEFFLIMGSYLPSVEGRDLDGRAGEVVHLGWGLWTTAAVLLLVALLQIMTLVRPPRPG
jgi:hypothetical protein